MINTIYFTLFRISFSHSGVVLFSMSCLFLHFHCLYIEMSGVVLMILTHKCLERKKMSLTAMVLDAQVCTQSTHLHGSFPSKSLFPSCQ